MKKFRGTAGERRADGIWHTRAGNHCGDEMEQTIARILKFRDERDWKKFHDPKNLAASISIEAGELLELFQWMSGEEATRYAAQNKERVSEEIADVAIYLIELADITGIDLAQAIDAKLEKNAKKYPVDKSRGVWTKYTDLK
jgi:NTP pyrophosphatase (non-canonical NTP hydrolase)